MLSDKLSTRIAIGAYGQVAQLVEQRTENPRAEGSSPPLTTINNREPSGSRFAFQGILLKRCCVNFWVIGKKVCLGLFAGMGPRIARVKLAPHHRVAPSRHGLVP